MYRNAWFEDRWAIQAPPPEAVADCSGPGRADEVFCSYKRELHPRDEWRITEAVR